MQGLFMRIRQSVDLCVVWEGTNQLGAGEGGLNVLGHMVVGSYMWWVLGGIIVTVHTPSLKNSSPYKV